MTLHNPGDQPRPEYPRPQFKRKDWINLNGTWSFTSDPGKSGEQKGYAESLGFSQKINVPFCMESPLSGIGDRDFCDCVWYQTNIQIPRDWDGQLIFLRFQAADYNCTVYVNGKKAGIHNGGSVPFSFDITALVEIGTEQSLVIKIEDSIRTRLQPSGKQSHDYFSKGCFYTRVTGIWQTVWLEPVHPQALESVHIVSNVEDSQFHITHRLFHSLPGYKLRVSLSDGALHLMTKEVSAVNGGSITLPIHNPKLWSPDSPFLYGLFYQVLNPKGQVIDEVESYAGLRQIHIEGDQVFLNGKSLFQRLVLDQGYYPDGIWTAPTDKDLRKDIEISKQAGFNGARLHQKVFEDRFHYWADKLGYLTWAEFPSWGLDTSSSAAARNYLTEWGENVKYLRNHPSIICWSPFNETINQKNPGKLERLQTEAYFLTKDLDPTRPVNTASGYSHFKTDIWSSHIYKQDPEKLKALLGSEGEVFKKFPEIESDYTGQPYFLAEFGGALWPYELQEEHQAWGYGTPKTEEEFNQRLQNLMQVIASHPKLTGFCYTQLTDVEQECNGIYTYKRSPKFSSEKISEIFKLNFSNLTESKTN